MSISINKIINSLRHKISHGKDVLFKEKYYLFNLEPYKCTKFYITRNRKYSVSITKDMKKISSEEYFISHIYIYPFKLEPLNIILPTIKGVELEGYTLSSNFNDMGVQKPGTRSYYAYKVKCNNYNALNMLISKLETEIVEGNLDDDHEKLEQIEKLRKCDVK